VGQPLTASVHPPDYQNAQTLAEKPRVSRRRGTLAWWCDAKIGPVGCGRCLQKKRPVGSAVCRL